MRPIGRKSDPIITKKISDQKNLKFLEIIMKQLNLTVARMSRLTGIPPQKISWWLKKDDALLDALQDMFKTMGIKLTYDYMDDEQARRLFTEENCEIEINGNNMLKQDFPNRMPVLQRIAESDMRLTPVAKLILKNYGTLPDFCKKYNMIYSTCFYWFKNDNIKVSNMYILSRLTGTKIKWKIEPIKKEAPTT